MNSFYLDSLNLICVNNKEIVYVLVAFDIGVVSIPLIGCGIDGLEF